MINTFIHRLLKRRHFWRHATFSEVAELYASRMMRLFAVRLAGTFTSVYLYQEGFSLVFIALYWAALYLLKLLFTYWCALLIARHGPKHATLTSNIVSAVAMLALPFVTDPVFGTAALTFWVTFQAFSVALNNLAYLIDFSKVKHVDHAGKEIGYMNIIEKVAAGISPLVGGVVALLFGAESIMYLAAVFFLLSAAPLFLTAEPIKLQHDLNFKQFPWRKIWRSMRADFGVGYDVFATTTAWSLFLVIVIFTSDTDRVYAEIGFVSSVTLFVALAASYMFGRLIDHRRGRELLESAAIANSVVHAVRPFVTTPFGAILINAINEATTAGYAMPFMRGMFDNADALNRRIEYLTVMEIIANIGALVAAVTLAGLFALYEGAISIQAFFVIAALVTILIAKPKFPLYKR